MGLDCNFEFAFKTHRKMHGYNFRGWVSSEKSPEIFVGKLAGKKCWKTHRKILLENSPEKMLENSPEKMLENLKEKNVGKLTENLKEKNVGKLTGKNVGKLKGEKCWKTYRKKRWKT